MQQDEKDLRSVSVLPPWSGGTTQDCHKLKLFSISSATDSPRQFFIKAEKNMYWWYIVVSKHAENLTTHMAEKTDGPIQPDTWVLLCTICILRRPEVD